MRIPLTVIALLAGCAVGAATTAVTTVRAQPPAQPAQQPLPPTPTGIRYQYHVLNLGWSNAEAAEQVFNGLGVEGWHVVAQAGSYVTFERSWPAR
jgi:hypothetical protein